MISLCITMGPDWPIAEQEFKRVGFNVERFNAIVELNRPLAFNKSVHACMKLAEGDSLLLFEDDVKFDDGIDFRSGLTNAYIFGGMPASFMTLHLGGNIIGTDKTEWRMPMKGVDGSVKLWNCWQSHATLYSAECVKFILDNFNPNILDTDHLIFDEWLRTNVLPMGRSYILNPMIAYQRPRHSEIWNTWVDSVGCHLQGNKWMEENL